MNLIIRKNKPGFLSLSLQRGFRVFFFLVALVIGIFLFLVDSDGKSNLGPVVILVLSIFCSGYYELWIFDRKRGEIEQRYGFFLFFKRKTFLINDLKYLQISSFIKGKMTAIPGTTKRGKNIWQKKYSELTLVTCTGSSCQIEITDQGKHGELRRKGELISQFCGVDLISLS